MSVAKLIKCVCVDTELHIKLLYKGSPLTYHFDFIMVRIVVLHARVCWKTFLFTYNYKLNSCCLVEELREYNLKIHYFESTLLRLHTEFC